MSHLELTRINYNTAAAAATAIRALIYEKHKYHSSNWREKYFLFYSHTRPVPSHFFRPPLHTLSSAVFRITGTSLQESSSSRILDCRYSRR